MSTIYDYIKSQEQSYNTIPIPVVENYEWHMARHVKLTTLYLNSQYETGNKDMKPFYNIILPAINVQHRSVNFHLKEINFFIDNRDAYYKSFLVRKYHQRWARVHDFACFLDDMTEQYTDYGGTLIKRTKDAVPVVVPFQQLAFCDQTDILSGPICEKHQYSSDKLKEMEALGWGSEANGATISVDELILLASASKTTTQVKGRIINTPSKYVEVYELYGMLPAKFLYDDGRVVEDIEYVRQLQVVAFYKDENDKEQGVTLFKGKARPDRYKFYARDPIYGRALGRGAVEELFDSQVWANYSTIQQKEMLDQASKIIYKTTDKTFSTRNQTSNMENGQVVSVEDGKDINQLNTAAPNVVLFERAVSLWNSKAQEISSSFNPFSGVGGQKISYRMGALLSQQASAMHAYRKGRLGGIFLPEVYRDWILPQIVKDLTKDTEFSAMLSMDEMEQVSEAVITNLINEHTVNLIWAGKLVDPAEIDTLKAKYKQQFFKHGTQKFFKILGGELKDVPIDMVVDFTQEEMVGAAMAEELTQVFSQLIPVISQNPQFFEQNPQMAKIFNDILQNSGLNPMDFTSMAKPALPVQNKTVPTPTLPEKTAPAGGNDAVETPAKTPGQSY